MAYSFFDRNYGYGKKFTYASLKSYVDRYNDEFCKDKSNHLEVARFSNCDRPGSGYFVYLTGNKKGELVSGLGSSMLPFVESEGVAGNCVDKLIKSVNDGSLKKFIDSHENPKYKGFRSDRSFFNTDS